MFRGGIMNKEYVKKLEKKKFQYDSLMQYISSIKILHSHDLLSVAFWH